VLRDDLVMQATNQITALADPTRRHIFELLRIEPSSVRALTDRLEVSQPAVSQHLKVLREASLVTATARGASNIYSIDRTGLTELRRFVDELWDETLDAFVEVAEQRKDQ
jgi:DNA-binding transcriptional ArsR family regulator